ncbi:hypothetical protein BpHYR1_016172 [Brachionus plicatilis]|uniref:Uncharacterized protein n=1 Tax=Brachionus plicatilis TaxID=10195 RepID=A0A3M7PEZ9_BRAPC|nr:hypothetical protein BpHYR1_016172 [Brachionus plicatilis]
MLKYLPIYTETLLTLFKKVELKEETNSGTLRQGSKATWNGKKSYDCDPDILVQFRECNMVQHSKLYQLSKSANDVQNLCKMHYARTD